MLHYKFVEIGSPVPEKIFERFLPYIMAWRPSWSCDSDAANKLSFPQPKEAPHKNLALIGQAVSEEKMFEIVNGRRTPEHGYPISSPMCLRLR